METQKITTKEFLTALLGISLAFSPIIVSYIFYIFS